MNSKSSRSFAKTLTWRIVATTDTFLIAWLITGDWSWAGAIAGIEVMTKMFLYYAHERVWDKIIWGRNYIEFPTMPFPYEDWKIKRLQNYLNRQGHKRLARLLQ